MPMPSPAPEPISSTRKKIKFDSPITVSRKSSTVTVRDQPTATIQDQPETGLDLNHTRYTPRLHYHSYDIAQAKLEYLLFAQSARDDNQLQSGTAGDSEEKQA